MTYKYVNVFIFTNVATTLINSYAFKRQTPKWSNTLKLFVGNSGQPTNCLSMFDHFVELVLKGLMPRTSSFSMCVAMLLLFMQALFRNRSSPPELFLGKDVLKISSKFRGEHLRLCCVRQISESLTKFWTPV